MYLTYFLKFVTNKVIFQIEKFVIKCENENKKVTSILKNTFF